MGLLEILLVAFISLTTLVGASSLFILPRH